MKKYQVNKINCYEVNPRTDIKLIDKLIDNDYIIIYDKSIDDKNEHTWLVAPCTLSTKQYYRVIKTIYPKSYAVYNMLEVGFIDFKFN